MFWQFLKYFFKYIFFSKTRQKLLFLAIFGLFISSFSLIILQSIMGGLQNGIVKRSISIEGTSYINFRDAKETTALDILNDLKELGIEAFLEYEIELLARHEGHVAPIIVHGIDLGQELPSFLKDKELNGIVLGADVAMKLKSDLSSTIKLISPAHTDSLIEDIPRFVTVDVSDIIYTDVPEIDALNAWTRLSLIQNLIKKKNVNKIRIYSHNVDLKKLDKFLKEKYGDIFYFRTWEDVHSSLIWALGLESKVMLALFIAMTLLVAISITTGFMIFFDKIKIDIISFWILGNDQKSLKKMSQIFIHVLSIATISLGLIFGLIFLHFLSLYGTDIMPSIFVERSVPVLVTLKGILISFFIPYLISIIFSYFALTGFSYDENSFISEIRSIG